MIKYTESKRKGQFNLLYSDENIERLNFVFHSNAMVPVRDTLHFGIKPGHFMLYVKRYDEDGKWVVKDAGYINYFRKDQLNIVQRQYNTILNQKLISRGKLNSWIFDDKVIVESTSIFPLHKRKITVNFKNYSLEVVDYFFGRTNIYFNTDSELIVDSNWWKNTRLINF